MGDAGQGERARDETINVECPRCGYDQRGVVDSWADACPLNGICTECGLEFEWAELLSATRRMPRWCVEYGRGSVDFLRRWTRTLGLVLWPWGFWKGLKISHEIRWRRILECHLFTLVVLAVWLDICFGLFLYGLSQQVGWFGAAVVTRATITDILVACVFPGEDIAIFSVRGNVQTSHQYFRDFWWPQIASYGVLVIHQLLCPVGFMLLPQSRRIAKVRWGHIIRITCYGMLLVVPIFTIQIAECGAAGLSRWKPMSSLQSGLQLLHYFYLAIYPVLLLSWWSTATGRYLRMRHAWGVGFAVVTLALLFYSLPFSIHWFFEPSPWAG
jgi:hypothetical protein